MSCYVCLQTFVYKLRASRVQLLGYKYLPVMTERLKIDEINCVDELIAFLEDNEVQEIDDVGEATDTLNRLEDIVARVRECHTGLKLALGDRYHTAYKGRDKHMSDAR